MKAHQRSGFSGAIKYASLAAWVAAGLAGMTAPGVWAKEATPTPDVVGFKPVADNVAIDNPAPTLGDTLNVTYDYSDEDGDAEAAPDIKWLYNGVPVAGQVNAAYTPVPNINTGIGNACGDFQVAAEVTPVSQTGDPLVGDAKQSAPVTVALNLPVIPGFTFPETAGRNWSDANAFCLAKGMRLPTRAELQAVFNTYTSGGTNSQMAEKYGWPLTGGQCGGSLNNYWTSEPGASGRHWLVGMHNGNAVNGGDDAFSYQVACVPGSAPAQLPTAVTLTHPSSGSEALNGANFADRPVVTVDEITANLTFVPDTDTDLSNYRFEWYAGGVSTGVVNDGDNTFTPRVEDQGKPIEVVVTLKL